MNAAKPQPLQCAACARALPDETPVTCPACGADLTAPDSVMLHATAGKGTRLIAWAALAMLAAIFAISFALLLR